MEQKFLINRKTNKISFNDGKSEYDVHKNDKKLEEKFAIVGSRSITDINLVNLILDSILFIFGKPLQIISGGAIGIDNIGENWAKENNIDINIIKPDWIKYGKKAGFIRNEDIISNCDICIAIWDGSSKGTKHDIELCTKYKKDLILINVSEYSGDDKIIIIYKQYNNTIEIEQDMFKQQPEQHKKHIYNRWLPQPGLIKL